jgi:antitoxin component YwqK of YwqJK toxin-antitoxin module
MGVLDGPFELKARRFYYDNSNNEINYWNLERKGEYIGGVQNGFWTFYTSWGAKSWQGNMLNGKKSGVWKHFVTVGSEFGKVMEELEFKYDQLDGLVKVYFEILEIEKEDSVRVFKAVPKFETSRYLSGVLNGKYEKLDSLNRVLEQGFYRLGKKFGKWIEVAHWSEDRVTPLIVCSGSYDNEEERDGLWSYTEVKSNQVIIKMKN